MNLADPDATQILVDLLASGASVQFVVTGASMRPFLDGGETVLLRRVRPEDLRCGDLILSRLYEPSCARLLLHRVVRIRRRAGQPLLIQTHGDACWAPDAWVTAEAVLGRVYAICRTETGAIPTNLVSSKKRIQARLIARRQRFLWSVRQARAALRERGQSVHIPVWRPRFLPAQRNAVRTTQASAVRIDTMPVPAPDAAQRERLLMLCLRARWEPGCLEEARAFVGGTETEWDELRPMVAAGGVAPLLYSVLAGRQLAPLALETWLRQAFNACYSRSLFMLMQLEEILHLLNHAGIQAILLKGAALIVTVYREAGLRPMTDLDLLLRREDVTRAVEVLGAVGFAPVHQDPRPGTAFAYENEVMLSGPRAAGLLIEVHWGLFDSPHHQAHVDMAWFWASAQQVKVGEAQARVLGPEALLLHLCGHLHLHHRRDAKLLWRHDIAEVLACYGDAIDWATLIRRAQQYDLVTPLQEVLPACARTWGMALPAEVLSTLCALEPSASERCAHARLAVAHDSVAGRFWTDVAALPGWRTRADYAWENLFPSAAFMRWRYRIRSVHLVPLYYPYRWFLAIRSAFGALSAHIT